MLKVLSSRHNYNYDMDIPSGDPKIPVVDTTTTTDSNDSKITILEEGEEGVIKKGWIGSNKVKKVDGKWKVWAGKTMGGWKDATQAELNKINKKYK
jgi:hypothetical protein